MVSPFCNPLELNAEDPDPSDNAEPYVLFTLFAVIDKALLLIVKVTKVLLVLTQPVVVFLASA
jgi:hypothetical protein